jgi:hypothetical protein
MGTEVIKNCMLTPEDIIQSNAELGTAVSVQSLTVNEHIC